MSRPHSQVEPLRPQLEIDVPPRLLSVRSVAPSDSNMRPQLEIDVPPRLLSVRSVAPSDSNIRTQLEIDFPPRLLSVRSVAPSDNNMRPLYCAASAACFCAGQPTATEESGDVVLSLSKK